MVEVSIFKSIFNGILHKKQECFGYWLPTASTIIVGLKVKFDENLFLVMEDIF